MYIDSINKMDKNYPLSSFGNVLICSNAINANKTVTFPDGYELDSNLSFKILFKNGHNCANNSTHMTLSNGTKAYPIVVNKYGTLIPLPIHKMSESSTTVYKSLQPNTILEMYFDSTYGTDGAFVVIGNPIVLSSDDYTIYADGKTDECLYEHNITGHIANGQPGTIQLNFNFTYIDNKSTCDYSDIQNALLKNPSINANAYKYKYNTSDLESAYFVRNLHINPPNLSWDIFNIDCELFQNNMNFKNETIYVSEILQDTGGGGLNKMLIKYITTNKINNLYQ